MSRPVLSIELALLGFLRRGPRHGYAIHQELAHPGGLGGVWQIKRSHLYALLAKLEDAGYIAATVEPQQARPPRRLFHLTEAGEQAFLAWVQSPVQNGRSLRLEFLVKLYFSRAEGPGVTAFLSAAQRGLCLEWLAAEQTKVDEEAAAGRRYGRLVHEFRRGQIQAMLAWIDRCEEE